MIVTETRNDEVDICKGYGKNDNGYVKGFSGDELLLRGETVVIAVFGENITDTFDIKINVAEERTLSNFDFKCQSERYTYGEIFDEIRKHSLLDDIQLYRDVNFQQLIIPGSKFDSSQTIYAQVKDALGNLKYIYTVNLKLREFDDFQQFFTVENSALRRKITCETVFNWQKE